jgi:hypothetical protein
LPFVLVSLAVVIALVAGSAYWLLAGGQRGSAPLNRSDGSASSSGSKAGEAADKKRRLAVTELLAARSRAIRGRDREAFLALIDPAAGSFKDRQAIIFDRLVTLPISVWEYEYAGEGPQLVGYTASLLPKGSFVAQVKLRYTFVSSDSPVESQQFLTLVPRTGRWMFAGDRDNVSGAVSGELGQDVWELGPVNVVYGRSSLVIGSGSDSALHAYAREADRAVLDVDALWRGKWSHRPVVIVPRTVADMAAVIGTSVQNAEQSAAMATGYDDTDVTLDDRVVINPADWRELDPVDRRIVMTHEVTHVATSAATDYSTPVWMIEGFADYVAYRAVDLLDAGVSDELYDLVAAGDAPRELPEDRDFDPGWGEVDTSYEEALLAVQMIAERHGNQKLLDLYVAMGDDEREVGQDIRAILGISSDELVKDWRRFTENTARS